MNRQYPAAAGACSILFAAALAPLAISQSDVSERRAAEPADQSSQFTQEGPILKTPGTEPKSRRRTEKPLLPVPPEPTPDPSAREEAAPGAAESAPSGGDARRARAVELARLAERLIAQGRYERAVQVASAAMGVDPGNAAAYRAVRAEAYQSLGRYKEALSDRSPLPANVGPGGAPLWSGSERVAVLPGGTEVMIEQIRATWLKVASAGDREFAWAWIHRDALARGRRHAAARMAVPGAYPGPYPDPASESFGYDRRRAYGDAYGGWDYGRPYELDIYINGRRFHFGREYYDWWRHVPPPYWRYLPR